ncbi:aldo/keto reductase [Inquilinus sp. Marseille-Q2685]|uniref:aldo/keto reductase n=1 Tax=Inquilinus sp. Marseille-Q2685 TaxID=2866581 RepID=UPI001CE42C55|nr:aldo/keto reductase [Inquilinus sp. Marseille-Q2685]
MNDQAGSLPTILIRLWDGREVPRLGLGCWAIGGPFFAGDTPLGYGAVDDAESIAAIHCAVDLGIRFFDTADVYGAGHSEEVLGRALEGRDDVVIATKLGNRFDPATKQLTGSIAEGDLKREARSAVEGSLRRLRRDRIDLVQLHLNNLPIERAGEVFDVLDDLRAAGTIGAYGWSTDFPERAAAHAGRDGFVAVQHGMNLFFDAPTMLGVIEANGLISINRSPLAMGLLTGKFAAGQVLPADDVRSNTFTWMDYFKDGRVAPGFADRLERIRHLLTADGRTPAQGALAWLWARSPRTLPIPGFRSVAQVRENAGALEKGPLRPEAMAEIEKLIDRPPEGPARER